MNNRITSALRVRPFLFLWLSEVFSQIAMNMMNFILILVAFSLTNSNTAVSGTVLSFTIPAIIFGLVAGAYVDLWDKKYVLVMTNAIRAFLIIILAFLHNNLLIIYVITFFISIATQFFIPAETPIIPLVVKKELLYSANSLFGIALYGSILLAYALSGPLLIFLGETNALIVLAVLYICAAFFAEMIREPKLAAQKSFQNQAISITKEIKSAVSVIFKIKEVYHSFILLILTQMLILIISVVGPGYAKHILGIGIDEFPLLFVTPAAIGMVIGAILLTNILHDYPKQKSATIGLFLAAISVLLLPYGSKVASRAFVHTLNTYLPHILTINILHFMVFLAFVLGFSLSLIFVPSNTILQEHTSDEVRGKIWGGLNATASLFSLLPIIIVGSLADIFGVGSVLTVVGFSIGLIAMIRLIF